MSLKYADLIVGISLIVFVAGDLYLHKEMEMVVPYDHTPEFPYHYKPTKPMVTQIASGSTQQWAYNRGINSTKIEFTIYPDHPILKPVRVFIPSE